VGRRQSAADCLRQLSERPAECSLFAVQVFQFSLQSAAFAVQILQCSLQTRSESEPVAVCGDKAARLALELCMFSDFQTVLCASHSSAFSFRFTVYSFHFSLYSFQFTAFSFQLAVLSLRSSGLHLAASLHGPLWSTESGARKRTGPSGRDAARRLLLSKMFANAPC